MIPEATLRWIARVVDGRRFEIAAEPLPDTSHENHRVSVGDGTELLLRRFADPDRATDPWYTPHGEVAALEALAGRSLPVPELIAADIDAVECDVPALLVTWLPGRTLGSGDRIDRMAFPHGLAEHLPAIHRCPLVERAYDPYFVSDGTTVGDLRPPRWTNDPAVWERAFEAAAGEPPRFEPRFIHRDYHQGNTLWMGERISGIVDWTTGSSGPVGIDLAQMRMNLAWEFDLELADAFLEAWRSIAHDPDAYHPYWEVLNAVDWLGDGEPDDETRPERLQRFERFVARALAELV